MRIDTKGSPQKLNERNANKSQNPIIKHGIGRDSGEVVLQAYPGSPETANLVLNRQKSVIKPIKRFLDLVIAVTAVVVLMPIWMIIALIIKLDSAGAVIFKQERLGLNGKPFIFYKFRSMHQDCNDKIHRDFMTWMINDCNKRKHPKAKKSFKMENDPRITRFGKLLRRTSLDELPQFINVIKGDMSIVGPRPPIRYETNLYTGHHWQRLSVIPGITGWWQVNGRSLKSFEEMVELDLFYIQNWSLWLDLKIVLRTFGVVLSRKGAF